MSIRLPWFRMYADFLNDPKMIALAFEDQRHFIGVLALKCDGAIDDVADSDLLDRIVAQRLWIDHAVIRDVRRRLVVAGLIDSKWQPVAWDRRQMRSDKDATAAERQRRFRESQKSNALRNAPVTRLDTDTDTEKEEKQEAKNHARARSATEKPADVCETVWSDYLVLRKTKRAPVTATAINAIRKEAVKVSMSLEDALAMCCAKGWQGFNADWIKPADMPNALPEKPDWMAGVI